jgi:hypothetical protein
MSQKSTGSISHQTNLKYYFQIVQWKFDYIFLFMLRVQESTWIVY